MGNNAFVALVMLFIVILAAAAAAAEGTKVSVRPGYLNAARFGTVAGKIYIEAVKPVTCDISITGAPADWLSYPESVYVEDEETVSFIVNPKTTGRYNLVIFVECPDVEFGEDVGLWVGYKGSSQIQPYANTGEDDDASFEDRLTGMFSLNEQECLMTLYAMMAIAAVFVVFVGHVMLKEDEYGSNA